MTYKQTECNHNENDYGYLQKAGPYKPRRLLFSASSCPLIGQETCNRSTVPEKPFRQ
jgi:hypothetical protein